MQGERAGRLCVQILLLTSSCSSALQGCRGWHEAVLFQPEATGCSGCSICCGGLCSCSPSALGHEQLIGKMVGVVESWALQDTG